MPRPPATAKPLLSTKRRLSWMAVALTVMLVTVFVSAAPIHDARREALDGVRTVAAGAASEVLAAWIIASRDSLIRTASPLPAPVEAQLAGYFPISTLARVRYQVGWPRGLPGLLFRLSAARAITLDHVIVFRDAAVANDPRIWAHELEHVRQFDLWGIDGFSARYVDDRAKVEEQAWMVTAEYTMWALETGTIK